MTATLPQLCQFRRGCTEPAVYVVTYDQDFIGGSYPACVGCTADARAHDPLEYIESVRTLGRPS